MLTMRSLHIAQHWASSLGGGAERVVAELAAQLPACGVGFHGLVTGPEDLAVTSNDLFESFAPEQSGTLSRLRGAHSNIAVAVQRLGPDVIASHFAMYAFPALRSFNGIPHVVHFHGPWAAESLQEGGFSAIALLKRAVERKVYANAARIIVLSRAFRDLVVTQYGVDPAKIRIVPGSVDTQRFTLSSTRADVRRYLGWPLERPILVSVRRLVSRMGLDRLIAAVQKVRHQVPGILLFIAGRGKQREALERQVREASLEQHVRFLGFVPDDQLPLIYRAADLNIVPTLALEGFGLVAAEAMATGTPSMVTPIGGLPEVVTGLSPHLVFPSADVEAIAKQLAASLTGAVLLPSEDACREHILTNFSSSAMARRTAEVYRELVQPPPHA